MTANDGPAGLGERGAALYASLTTKSTIERSALALEAARTVDRLDELDNIIQGKGVLNLMQFRVLDKEIHEGVMSIEVNVQFQSVLAEARQQATALSGLLKALGIDAAAAAGAAPGATKTGDDMLAQRRAERAAGSK